MAVCNGTAMKSSRSFPRGLSLLKISVTAVGRSTSENMPPKRLDAHSDGADRQPLGRQRCCRPREIVGDEIAGSPCRAKDGCGCHDGIENSSIERGANGARGR